MKRRLLKSQYGIVLLIGLILFFVGGCSFMKAMFSMPEEAKTQAGAYYLARRALNDYWENYLTYRDSLPDGETKQKLRDKFDDIGKNSIFTEGNKALDIWGEFIDTPEAYTKEKIFDLILDEILKKLLTEGLIQIEMD